jgi:4-carboxymuconolactone decarboxylase
MVEDHVPAHFTSMRDRFPKVMEALEELGKAARQQGPLDNKTAHLIQRAAAAAIQSEGAVHSHVQRATAAGATHDEIYHAVLLLVSTIGFPRLAAAISWVDDLLAKPE